MADRPRDGGTLVAVRRDLEEIDRAVVLLVAARVEAAVAAIRVRSARDGKLACPAQETRVLARARSWGAPLGLEPELIETIFRAMMDTGKARFIAARRLPAPVPRGRARDRSTTRTLARELTRPAALS